MKINKQIFFDQYRTKLDKDKKLTQKEVDAIGLFIDMFERVPEYFTIPQWAYVFATVFHETAHNFEPVREAFQLSENWRERNLRYFPYYGRGYVQITWLRNYKLFADLMGIDFVKNPDWIMQPEWSFQILIYGFKHGSFTGKKISDYINPNKKNYKLARYCINGADKRDLIASYAVLFEGVLEMAMEG